MARSMHSRYSRAVTEFWAFRKRAGLSDVWPIPMEHIIQFYIVLKGKDLAKGSIAGKLAGLPHHSKAWGFSVPTGDFCVWKMLEGWAEETP